MPLSADPQTILQTMTRTLQAAFGKAGYSIQITPTSDFYLKFIPIANQYALIANAVQIGLDNTQEDTATGTNLDRLANKYGIFRRSSTPSEGFITIQCSVATNVLSGSTLSYNGFQYQVSQAGSYSNGNSIPIVSIDTGANTNITQGSVLTWISVPAFTSTTALAATDISGGADAEDDAALRARLIGRLQNPASAGNAQDIIDLCLGFDPTIQAAFVYSGVLGAGTQHIAVIRSQELASVDRDIPITPNIVNLTSFLAGNLPGFVSTVISTITNITYNVAFSFNIPLPGVGNSNVGWVDSNPWPVRDQSNDITFCSVTAVTSNNSFTIASKSGSTAINANVTNLNWIDRSNSSNQGWLTKQSLITAFTDNGNDTYTVTVNNPFVGIAVGDYIFPAAYRSQIYLNTVLSSFAALGPGQKTNVAAVLPMANRTPFIYSAFNDRVDLSFVKALINSGIEVDNCDFSYQQYDSNEPPLPTNLLSSPITTSTNNPSLYVPLQIGFYPTV